MDINWRTIMMVLALIIIMFTFVKTLNNRPKPIQVEGRIESIREVYSTTDSTMNIEIYITVDSQEYLVDPSLNQLNIFQKDNVIHGVASGSTFIIKQISIVK